MPFRIRARTYQWLLDTVKMTLPHVWFAHLPRRQSLPYYLYRIVVLLYVVSLKLTLREKRETLQILVERRLSEMLRIAKTVPYWRNLLPTEALQPLTTLSKLPISTRALLRNVPTEQLKTTTAAENMIKWRRTSGTTGTPFSWGCDARTYHVDFPAFFFRMLAYYGCPWHPFAATQICILNIRDVPHNPLAPFARTVQWSPHADDSERQLRDVLAALSCNDAVLLTYPTDLWFLIQELKKNDVRPRLAYVISTGQMLEEEIRSAAEEYFSCPVRSFYATREVYAVAMECKKHSGVFHVNEENVVLEIVDAKGKETRDGDWGDVVLTSLYNRVMPLFRYTIGDRGRFVPGMCDCGISLRRIELQGRGAELIAHGKYALPAHEIGSVILNQFFKRISQYQIREEESGIRILVVPVQYTLTESDCELLRASISVQLGDAIPIIVEQVHTIPRVGNKFERFVPLRRV